MLDIRQSLQFANFMKDLGWKVEKINSTYIYLRHFPLFGYFAKISRPKPPISIDKIPDFIKTHKVFKLKISPFLVNTDTNYSSIRKRLLSNGFRIEQIPFNPTTNIHIDLTQSEEKIFKNFKEAKRRAVRRALKNEVVVEESTNINEFIKIRKQQFFPLGFLVVNEMKKLWRNFYPNYASLLLAYQQPKNFKTPRIRAAAKISGVFPIAGILLLLYDQIAYYWYASSLPIGKKLFAPTLLTWEAIKLAKKRGCKIFDFEGVYDERFPKASKAWRGFTKFKEGFGGGKVVLMENFMK